MQMEEEANAPTSSRPGNKNELLDCIQKEWSALMQSIATLTDEQMTTSRGGAWSVKDNLAHLAAWEQFLLQHHLGGQPPHHVLGVDAATFETLDEDGMNAVIYERHKDRSVEDVLDGLQRSHEQVLDKLEGMTFAELTRPRHADDPMQRPVMNWVISNTCEHYREHRVDIGAVLG